MSSSDLSFHATAPDDRARRIREIRERLDRASLLLEAPGLAACVSDLCDALLAGGVEKAEKAEDNTRPVSSGLEDSADAHGVAVPLPSNPADAALLVAEQKIDALRKETVVQHKALVAIANLHGIDTPLQLIAKVENGDETYADLLVKAIRQRLSASKAALNTREGAQ